MGIYWDINKILPYQRNFNFINGERSIGKTYTTQKFLLEKAIKQGKQFVYIVRTQSEKIGGIFDSAFAKVSQNEYPNTELFFETDTASVRDNDGSKREIGFCIALTESIKVKKRSFPNVKYLMFDEYMLEESLGQLYVRGWKEPELFLSIYHTIDREEDRVVCFLLGNNTSFYNPYHMHPAFNVSPVKQGEIWCSKNVLYQWAVGSGALAEKKAKSKFVEMIEATQYGTYAVHGNFSEDNSQFIDTRNPESKQFFSIYHNDFTFGIWADYNKGLTFVSDKFDPSLPLFAINPRDHTEDTKLDKTNFMVKWLARNYKQGRVRFESIEIKKRFAEVLFKII